MLIAKDVRGQSDSRRRLEHGEEVEGDVDKSSESDDTAADVKDGVVAIMVCSALCGLHVIGRIHLSMRTPTSR